MVGHGNRQDERQHPNVVHGPNANPHRTRPAQQPNRASPTARSRYATCEIQSSVRRKHGDQHRKRHERVVVRANQIHGSYLTPSIVAARFRPAPLFNPGVIDYFFLAGGSSSFAAILTKSASDSACILRITCPRWIFTVISLVPSSNAICLLSMPETTRAMTSRSRGVSDS